MIYSLYIYRVQKGVKPPIEGQTYPHSGQTVPSCGGAGAAPRGSVRGFPSLEPTRKVHQIGTDTEPGTSSCADTHGGDISIQNAKGGRSG